MKTLEEIKQIISEHKKELKEKYKVQSITIFGSYVRNEQKETSDIDILVEFSEPVGFLFFHLADYLEEILKVKCCVNKFLSFPVILMQEQIDNFWYTFT